MKNYLIILLLIFTNKLYSQGTIDLKKDAVTLGVYTNKVCNEDVSTYDEIEDKIRAYKLDMVEENSHELVKLACFTKIHCLANDVDKTIAVIKALNLPNMDLDIGGSSKEHIISSCSNSSIIGDFIFKVSKTEGATPIIFLNLDYGNNPNAAQLGAAISGFDRKLTALFEASVKNIKDIAPNAVSAIAEYINSGVSEDALKILVDQNELGIALNLDDAITKLAEKTELNDSKDDLNKIYKDVYKFSKKTDGTFDVDKFKAAITPIIETHNETDKSKVTKYFKRIFDVIALLDNKINPANPIKTNLEIIKVISDLFKNLSPAVNPTPVSNDVNQAAINDFNKYIKDELARDAINKYFNGDDKLDKTKVNLKKYMEELGKANAANQELINKIYKAFTDASGNDDTLKTKLAEIVTNSNSDLAKKILTIIYALDKLNKGQDVKLDEIEKNVRELITDVLVASKTNPGTGGGQGGNPDQTQVPRTDFDVFYSRTGYQSFFSQQEQHNTSYEAYAHRRNTMFQFNPSLRQEYRYDNGRNSIFATDRNNNPILDTNGSKIFLGMGRAFNPYAALIPSSNSSPFVFTFSNTTFPTDASNQSYFWSNRSSFSRNPGFSFLKTRS